MNSTEIIFASGICSRDSVMMLQKEADEVVGVSVPEVLYSVGQWYRDFTQTMDTDVIRLLNLARQA